MIAVLDAEITLLPKTKQESSHAKLIDGLTKIEQDAAAVGKLLERLAAIKAEVGRYLTDRLLAKNGIIDELKGVVARRAANKNSCREAAIDLIGSDKAATAFGDYIASKLEQAGVPGFRALVEGIFAADLRLGDGGKSGKVAWASAMDERFPMLKCAVGDDPQCYDEDGHAELPWHQRAAASFGKAQNIIAAVGNLKAGPQARGI